MRCRGVGPVADDGDDGRRRSGDYRSARIGAAAALVLVVVFWAVADVLAGPEFDIHPVVLMSILGTLAGLVGIELSNLRGGK